MRAFVDINGLFQIWDHGRFILLDHTSLTSSNVSSLTSSLQYCHCCVFPFLLFLSRLTPFFSTLSRSFTCALFAVIVVFDIIFSVSGRDVGMLCVCAWDEAIL